MVAGTWENWPEGMTVGELSLCLDRAVLESWRGGTDTNLDGVTAGEPVCLLSAAISRRGGPAPYLGKAGEVALSLTGTKQKSRPPMAYVRESWKGEQHSHHPGPVPGL